VFPPPLPWVVLRGYDARTDMNKDRNFEFALNYVSKQQVKEGLVYYSIPKRDVLGMDFSRIDRNMGAFKECRKHGKGKLLMTFAGFDDDPSEVFEIMEIRKYVGELVNKHPYLFYFLTDIDNNNQLILACLSDIETYTFGDERVSLNDIVFKGVPRSEIGIRYNINSDLVAKIKVNTMQYGLSVGDKELEVKRLLDRLFDLTPKKIVPEENDLGNIRDHFLESNMMIWMAFTNTYKRRIIDSDDIGRFADANYNYIINAMKGGWLSTPILIDRETTSNVFIMNDKAHGVICDKCKMPVALIIKKDFEVDRGELDKMVFIPSVEVYIQNKIFPFDEFYLNQIPLPINPLKDLWYCPRCKSLHSFSMSRGNELVYNQ
jgi:hypothetical protein